MTISPPALLPAPTEPNETRGPDAGRGVKHDGAGPPFGEVLHRAAARTEPKCAEHPDRHKDTQPRTEPKRAEHPDHPKDTSARAERAPRSHKNAPPVAHIGTN